MKLVEVWSRSESRNQLPLPVSAEFQLPDFSPRNELRVVWLAEVARLYVVP